MMRLLQGLAEGQILQRVGMRGAETLLAGECSEHGLVRATLWAGGKQLKGWRTRKVGISSRGRFEAKLSGIPAGGPYRLTLSCEGSSVALKSFYVGDVWLLAGQSNMQGIGNREGAAKPHPLIRAFSLRREWRLASDPLHVLAESPDFCHNNGRQCTPDEGEELRRNNKKGVGVGVFFAREIFQREKVPQGLICAAHGGTSMQEWNPDRKAEGGASLYASMLQSVKATNQPIAGVLWYQGESDANAEAAACYSVRMASLVQELRRDLRQSQLPWVVVQLARLFVPGSSSPSWWNSIQEQQRLLPSRIARVETIASIDLPLDDSVHIGAEGFPRLGRRMARAMIRLTQKPPAERPPQIRKIHAPKVIQGIGWTMDLKFSFIGEKLQAKGEPQGFGFVNAKGEKEDIIFKTSLTGDTVRLNLVSNPLENALKIGYGLGFSPVCNITDARDLSLPVFGPLEPGEPSAVLPFVTTWKVTKVLPETPSLRRIRPSQISKTSSSARIYNRPDGFVDEHERWSAKPGHAFFITCLQLPERMKLEFLMGYDGPFRLWLNEKPFFSDLNGSNPAIPDQSCKTAILSTGTHKICVGMSTKGGLAWGFFLRFRRRDVPIAKIRSGKYPRPAYLLP